MPAARAAAVTPAIHARTNPPAPAIIKLDGILWGSRPVAIINGRSFLADDQGPIKVGSTNVLIRCLGIQPKAVRIRNVDSGREQELVLPVH